MKMVYFDHMSTTPLHPEALKAMMPFLGEAFGNPSSTNPLGEEAKAAMEEARASVAKLIGATPREILFTSCGSESNNMVVKGLLFHPKLKGKHIITTKIEHYSILHPCRTMERLGFTVTYLPVDRHGLVDPSEVEKAITPETVLVCITHASNELGALEPIEEIGKITRANGVHLHCDGVQTVGTIPVDVTKLGVDTLSLAAQQFFGPKGAAALYVRKGVRIFPLIEGGIQELGIRAGTENVAGIVGMGKAASLAMEEMPQRMKHTNALRERLIKGLVERLERIHINGHPYQRLPGILSVGIEAVEGESMVLSLRLKGIACSSGSPCTSVALKASHVLLAIGLSGELASGSLLLSFGKDNAEEEVDYFLETFPPIVNRLRMMSAL